MSTVIVTSKGRITIPATVRAALCISPGDRVEFVQIEPGRFELVAAAQQSEGIDGKSIAKHVTPYKLTGKLAEITSDRKKAEAFLKSAGILTSDGELAPPYR
jgi:AbrB family looped-hinge helix DNA binding protein